MKHVGLPNRVGTMFPHKKQNNTLQDLNKPLSRTDVGQWRVTWTFPKHNCEIMVRVGRNAELWEHRCWLLHNIPCPLFQSSPLCQTIWVKTSFYLNKSLMLENKSTTDTKYPDTKTNYRFSGVI